MAGLLREQVQLYTAQSEQHRLELAVAGERLPVRGDANRLAQVVGTCSRTRSSTRPTAGASRSSPSSTTAPSV